jgi:hypothetical protein
MGLPMKPVGCLVAASNSNHAGHPKCEQLPPGLR